jgi:superfamily II DNA helicase RecQ
MLCELFRMDQLVRLWEKFRKSWSGTAEKVYDTEYRGLLSHAAVLEDARDVAMKFERQLRHIQLTASDDDTFLKERVRKASAYFLPILEEVREFSLACGALDIDNKETKARVKEAFEQLQICLDIKCLGIAQVSDTGAFSVADYSRIKTQSNLEDRKPGRKSSRVRKLEGTSSVNEELRERLQAWRNERFKQDNIPAYMIMHQSTLLSIASLVPQTKKELLAIKGFGEASFKKYGEEILAITAEFANHQ